jgi:serine protease AprX
MLRGGGRESICLEDAMDRTARTLGRLSAVALVVLIAAGAANASVRDTMKLWVFFKDKRLTRVEESAAIAALRDELPARVLERRAKAAAPLNVNDLPVALAYIDAVAATGARIETKSRWLNAVSVLADDAQAAAIEELPFVRKTRPVARAVKPRTVLDEPVERRVRPPAQRLLDYGASFGQLEQIGVPGLHNAGFDGSGVLISVLDTGFDTDHECFRHLDIVAERDFIDDDSETAHEPGDPPGQDSHGTQVLSCIAAAKPGELYGGAYNAGFALAKTEIVNEEIQIEEDYWVEAVEWADSLGSDIVTSSLGYFDWYAYEDMDGNTAITTIAADMAAARGIVVVNSMGNEGGGEWTYMIAPADGDSVLSVGAVDSTGARVYFSSVGPTYDGRTKPDVMAQGLYVHVATTEDTSSYTQAHGTSFAAPLVASAVVLLLQGHPDWIPTDVIDAARATASSSETPDNLMGWGILNAYEAMYHSPVNVDGPSVVGDSRGLSVFPNPIAPGTRVEFFVPKPSHVKLSVYDVSGRLVRTLVDGEKPRGTFEVLWGASDANGSSMASGVYFLRMTSAGRESTTKVALVR